MATCQPNTSVITAVEQQQEQQTFLTATATETTTALQNNNNEANTSELIPLHSSYFQSVYFQECDLFNSVTCVDLGVFNEASNVDGQEHSVCLQCPDGTAGDGKECRGREK